ncbi:hypothetical protein B0H63DRAFT_450450 [Podospora didyma]|uniref:Uncharacterized protein n=1 Tax=Podospora didyma TaxID=330526 RepID=A0AAE0NGJ8_9PEZI|nr:hypothetical protein B0H63DRAFT_450450 [Podospora didyma]
MHIADLLGEPEPVEAESLPSGTTTESCDLTGIANDALIAISDPMTNDDIIVINNLMANGDLITNGDLMANADFTTNGDLKTSIDPPAAKETETLRLPRLCEVVMNADDDCTNSLESLSQDPNNALAIQLSNDDRAGLIFWYCNWETNLSRAIANYELLVLYGPHASLMPLRMESMYGTDVPNFPRTLRHFENMSEFETDRILEHLDIRYPKNARVRPLSEKKELLHHKWIRYPVGIARIAQNPQTYQSL